jgi:hypothetical protein
MQGYYKSLSEKDHRISAGLAATLSIAAKLLPLVVEYGE